MLTVQEGPDNRGDTQRERTSLRSQSVSLVQSSDNMEKINDEPETPEMTEVTFLSFLGWEFYLYFYSRTLIRTRLLRADQRFH